MKVYLLKLVLVTFELCNILYKSCWLLVYQLSVGVLLRQVNPTSKQEFIQPVMYVVELEWMGGAGKFEKMPACEQHCLHSYQQQQISQSDCDLIVNCGII